MNVWKKRSRKKKTEWFLEAEKGKKVSQMTGR